MRRIREFIGDLWGKTTTAALGAIATFSLLFEQVLPQLRALPVDVTAVFPGWLRVTVACGTLILTILRFVAPPPKAVTIRTEDRVEVNARTGAVTITKPDGPAGTVAKAHGEPVA